MRGTGVRASVPSLSKCGVGASGRGSDGGTTSNAKAANLLGDGMAMFWTPGALASGEQHKVSSSGGFDVGGTPSGSDAIGFAG